ncbi:hypothetical protein BRADI_2g21090v3 [Brachypodium distachyon]|uniref:Uncharacterized protein n=1 Tax=Brachypodium distachyon TaxID=15368 RepID=A0A0Q3IIE1_BRADI|nr:hypothetical protein BRADI_2g21090v3 [Brachypodium distachyon]
MTSPREDAPVSTKQQSSPDRETNNGSPPRDRARAPRRPDMGTGCALLCFHLPIRPTKKKKKKLKQPGPLAKLGPGDESTPDDYYYASEAAASQRVTFLASASLSTWWPSSPSALSADGGIDGAWRRSPSGEAAARGGGAGARLRTLSSSFSYWRRSQTSSSRVMPHGADHHQSFSFPSSPVSVSSCLSTPRISHGCNRE